MASSSLTIPVEGMRGCLLIGEVNVLWLRSWGWGGVVRMELWIEQSLRSAKAAPTTNASPCAELGGRSTTLIAHFLANWKAYTTIVSPGRVMSYDSYSLLESGMVKRCPFENLRVKVPFS